MMRVFIVRHAESSFTASSDHQRPLTTRGGQQAEHTAEFIAENTIPGKITLISSDALRTLTTAEIIQTKLGCECHQDIAYYHAQVGDWCDALSLWQSSDNLILVGHNPTMSNLARFLNPVFHHHFSPADVAVFELEIAPDGLRLPAQFVNYFRPNES